MYPHINLDTVCPTTADSPILKEFRAPGLSDGRGLRHQTSTTAPSDQPLHLSRPYDRDGYLLLSTIQSGVMSSVEAFIKF
ncbi:hypothetical protein KGM_201019 [Danaus plexippus plexippus]|uniref:Uncharacterized protein n=1 Tax=Danaus plexippus plexippus TaxID=278856 RepID=A0A212FES4_DANPL|nr:hypothetical protein KGM_201019 [Danaus plexippus plexippus]